MDGRKLSAAKIFDGRQFLEGHVLIVGKDGTIDALLPDDGSYSDIEMFDGILSPGFVNCHCHLELSHMKGRIPEKRGLVDFVLKVVTERHHDEEEILNSIAEAEEEMWENGVVAVGDISNNGHSIPQKQKGRLRYYNFIEASGWLPSVSQQRFDRALALLESFSDIKPVSTDKTSRHSQSVVPHAPYSVSEDLWALLQPLFENKVVSIHNQETAFEDEFFLKGTGDFQRLYELMNISNDHHIPSRRSSIRSYFGKMKNAASVILVHNTYTGEDDLDFIKNEKPEGVFMCLCVNANLYIENRLPLVELFRKKSCRLVLGTDSLASNWSLDMMSEIRTIKKHFPSIPLAEVLQWATSNGAGALQMDDELGSFENGKKPGIVLIDENNLHARRIL